MSNKLSVASRKLQEDFPPTNDAGALSPSQSTAFEQLVKLAHASPFVLFEGRPGSGKTTLLERLIAQRRGVRISTRDLTLATANTAHPCVEEQLYMLLEAALRGHDVVAVDDFYEIFKTTFASKGYERTGFINVPLRALIDQARSARKTLILCADSFWITPEVPINATLHPRSVSVDIPALDASDFAFFLNSDAPLAPEIDSDRIFQYSPGLNVYQLKQLARLIRLHNRTEETFVRDLIDTRVIHTNAQLHEVENITFDDLKGFETIVDRLTTFVINPLRQDSRFDGLGLKPKRGVLLYGPPGTGKTSIGRALAHQMKGKFFMIDGTIPPEPAGEFFGRIKQVFQLAKAASPSVIFIDDADVLFQSDRATSLNRYLLTMLDGLESETAGKVAVIMTAMDPNHMPPPLLRSGRVELWLETRPPAANTRAAIIAAHLKKLPAQFHNYDASRVAELTDGFNAADMRRVVADVKALYAADVIAERPIAAVDEYFEMAARNVQNNKAYLTLAETGKLSLSTATVATGRSDAERKSSRIRDEMNSCEGE